MAGRGGAQEFGTVTGGELTPHHPYTQSQLYSVVYKRTHIQFILKEMLQWCKKR